MHKRIARRLRGVSRGIKASFDAVDAIGHVTEES
jgi:hypothetical protein